MNNTFSEITQPFIKTTLSKNNTSVLALIIVYETRGGNPKKYFRVLICFVYSIIKNCVCFDYLACPSNKLSEINVGCIGGSKYGDKSFDRILGIGIPDLLMNLISCYGFLRNVNYVVIFKYPKRMLE